LYDRPETKDTNFSWKELEKTINQILIGDFGNFVNRVMKFLEKYYDLKVPAAELTVEDKELLDKIHVTEEVISDFS
jgi:methionyl-tRNA synthetase